MNEQQFAQVFDHFDYDKDGKISYADMRETVGNVLNPEEGFYFRQEYKAAKPTPRKCQIEGCPRIPVGFSQICIHHTKQKKQEAIQILLNMSDRVSNYDKCP